jgi:RNA polymerase sigma-70 factor (ECF subfamily)
LKTEVTKACAGDQKAFERLIVPLENKMYRVARTVLLRDADCADAMQEALLRAWSKMPQLQDGALFEPWLMRILVRECYRLLRRNKPAENIMFDEYADTADLELSIDLRRVTDTLPPHERMVLVLHYTMDYGVKDVAKILRIPIGTVKSRLARGRHHLAQKLKEVPKWREI